MAMCAQVYGTAQKRLVQSAGVVNRRMRLPGAQTKHPHAHGNVHQSRMICAGGLVLWVFEPSPLAVTHGGTCSCFGTSVDR